jgi:hypothetical protein
MLWRYKSDNTNYPDPKNLWEAILLWWRNLWDKEYQESKKLYERLHRHDNKISKSEKAKQFTAMKKQAQQMKRDGQSSMKQK